MVARTITAPRAGEALQDLRDLPLVRYAHTMLIGRIWDLRDNLTACDAAYVALAQAPAGPLLTCDRRIASASGHHARAEVA